MRVAKQRRLIAALYSPLEFRGEGRRSGEGGRVWGGGWRGGGGGGLRWGGGWGGLGFRLFMFIAALYSLVGF